MGHAEPTEATQPRSEIEHDTLDGLEGAVLTRTAVGVSVAAATGADVAAGGGSAPSQLPQSVQSVPAEQNFGSSHIPSFAYLHESAPPGEGAAGVARVGVRVTGVLGAKVEAVTGARVGVRVEGAMGADVEDEHAPHVLGHTARIVAPCMP